MSSKVLLAGLMAGALSASCINMDNITSPDTKIIGSGTIITEPRVLADFSAVQMSTAGKVYITQGDTQEVIVTVDDNITPYIVTSVSEGKLFIGTRQHVTLSHYNLVVEITMRDIEELVTSSAGSISGKNPFKVDQVSLILTSAGEIGVELEALQLRSVLSSAGDLFVRGAAEEHIAVVSSAGSLHAFSLLTDNTKITLSSAGNAEVFAAKSLDATLSSVGSLYTREIRQ